ncbi:MAG TPA: hypothetical protein PLR29_04850 [Acetivibrio saccincola]|nr:hypothetical protein [Acetivibrio saccincola]
MAIILNKLSMYIGGEGKMGTEKFIYESIKKNIDILKRCYGCNDDIEITYFKIKGESDLSCASIYFKDLVDKKL